MLRHPDASSSIGDSRNRASFPSFPTVKCKTPSASHLSGKLGTSCARAPPSQRHQHRDYFPGSAVPAVAPEIAAAIDEHPTPAKSSGSKKNQKTWRAFLRRARIGQLVQSKGLKMRSIKRSPSAARHRLRQSPELEQKTLLSLAFTTSPTE